MLIKEGWQYHIGPWGFVIGGDHLCRELGGLHQRYKAPIPILTLMLTNIWRKNSTTKAPWSVGGRRWWRSPLSGGKPWEGIQLQKRDPRSGCNHTCNRSSSGRGRWELQGTNLSEMKAPGVRDLDFHQWHLSKINVCLRVAPHLLLVGTFYLGQLNILSIMHWRIRGQHCEIPPDNHHQVPWSY